MLKTKISKLKLKNRCLKGRLNSELQNSEEADSSGDSSDPASVLFSVTWLAADKKSNKTVVISASFKGSHINASF